MSRTGLNRVLFAVIAVLVLLAWFLRRDVAQPNFVFMPEMVYSVPYDSFSANPNFSDGKTQQLPVAGTIARGDFLSDYQPTEADALRAGRELSSPWTVRGVNLDALIAAKDRGRQIYSAFCLPCHGAVGNGDGPVSLHGFPPPPSLILEHSMDMSDGQMFHVITFGQKNMPAYANLVEPADRWKAILHVRSIQESARRKAEAELRAQESIAVGQQAFQRLNCHKCHTVSPDEPPVGPNLSKIAPSYTREQLLEAIMHPSRSIAEGYVTQTFLMLSGKSYSGFVTRETEQDVTIRDSQGVEYVLAVAEIDERKTLEKSPMPDGVIQDLSEEELQSLLDYLKSLGSESNQEPPADSIQQ